MKKHEKFLKQAFELALSAQEKGNHPFGALLVVGDRVVLTAENSVTTDKDITRHAELNLVSRASRDLDPETLNGCILYTSTEPCAMCAGAIFWTGIPTIVYGCSAEVLGEIAGGVFVVPSRDLLKFGSRPTQVIGPLLEDEGAAIHRDFWMAKD